MVRHKNRYLLFHVHWILPQPIKSHGGTAGGALAKFTGQKMVTEQQTNDELTEKVHIYPDSTSLETAHVDSLHGGHLIKVIRDAIQLNMGDLGAGSTSTLSGNLSFFFFFLAMHFNVPDEIGGTLVKYYNAETCVGILRVPISQHKFVWAALSTITEIKNVKCSIRVIHSSGTIQRCQKHALEDDQKRLRYLRYLQQLLKSK